MNSNNLSRWNVSRNFGRMTQLNINFPQIVAEALPANELLTDSNFSPYISPQSLKNKLQIFKV